MKSGNKEATKGCILAKEWVKIWLIVYNVRKYEIVYSGRKYKSIDVLGENLYDEMVKNSSKSSMAGTAGVGNANGLFI